MDFGIEKATVDNNFYKTSKKIILTLVLFFVFILAIYFRVQTKYNDQIIEINQIESPAIGLVFGAGLLAKGVPSDILKDRIKTAINLYQEGKVSKFVFSGDNTGPNHNEVQAMKNYAIEQGLPEDSIIEDHAGTSTYDSCYRYKNIFNLNKAILITQKYHLKRALYTCNEIGIDAKGISAIDTGYVKQTQFTAREIAASIKAWIELNITHPKPIIN